jgi:hypothetical protein
MIGFCPLRSSLVRKAALGKNLLASAFYERASLAGLSFGLLRTRLELEEA